MYPCEASNGPSGCSRAVTATALHDPDESVRMSAARALVKFGVRRWDNGSLTPLVRCLTTCESGWQERLHRPAREEEYRGVVQQVLDEIPADWWGSEEAGLAAPLVIGQLTNPNACSRAASCVAR